MANEMIERVARAIGAEDGEPSDDGRGVDDDWWRMYERHAKAAIEAMREPTEAVWDGLPRQLIMWMDMGDKTPRALFRHLERSGHDVPQWLRDESEMQSLDHVPSKGTRAVLIFRAMLSAALNEQPRPVDPGIPILKYRDATDDVLGKGE